MTTIQVCKAVVDTKTCHLVRPRKTAPGYDAKPFNDGGSKRGWFYLDMLTASVVLKVHEALSEENRPKLEALPISKAVRVCWKLVR